jgi:uncharacterized membrane protein (UPF0182 family)
MGIARSPTEIAAAAGGATICEEQNMAIAQTATVRPRSRDAPAQRVSLWRTPRTRALLIVATIGAAVALVSLAARVYLDVLWYRELGQERVFWTTATFRLLGPAVVGLGTTCALLLNFAFVERLTRGAPEPERRAVAQVWRYRKLVYPLVAIACGVVTMDHHDEAWPQLMLWANRSDFGVQDPLFQRDVGFFVFSLPLYREVAQWLLETLLLAGLGTVAAYAVAGMRAARAHLLWLLGLLLLVTAWRLRLDQYALALPHEGSVVPGASYTDVHVRLPVLRVLMFLSLAGAALCAYGAVRRVRLALMAALGLVALAAIGAGNALPSLIERFDVAPQALARERPYVADAIASTQRAFDLDAVSVRSPSESGELTADDLAANASTIDNVPLWDPSVLRPAMNELQTIGGYYGFRSTSTDRYTIGGVPKLVTVGARQLDLSRLRRSDRTWANTRFAYTHGYGVVAAEAGQADVDRYPRFAQREFRSGSNPLRLTQPRIYYGQGSEFESPYLVLNSDRGEVEQPAPGTEAPDYHYDGPGGIALSSLLRRAAFAARFGDLKLLLTQTANESSRIALYRNAGERLRKLAPFLRWDAQPQTAVINGRVQFLFHGYTTSDHYPYSARVRMGNSHVNYIRAPALAAVDSFSGQVTIYAVDGEEPILRAWRAVYPTLFQPATEMPPALRSHLRYSRRLFEVQARAYATYHASDPTAFWNGSDVWQPSTQVAGPVEDAGEIQFPDPEENLDEDERREGNVTPEDWRMRSSYLLARLPGDRKERFMLAAPFSPRGRQNLVAYLAGSVDRRGRPQLTLLSLKRDRLTIGPSQATREILADPAVNRRLQLLNRESRDLGRNSVNRTVLGDPRVVPIGDALVHIQPVYVIAGGSGLPRLQLVTAYANGHVGYGRDLTAALRRLLRA